MRFCINAELMFLIEERKEGKSADSRLLQGLLSGASSEGSALERI